MKLKAALKTSIYYIVVVFVCCITYCLVHSLRVKIYDARASYIIVIEYSLIKYISVFTMVILFVFIISITKEVYLHYLNEEKINSIINKTTLNTNDWRILLKNQYDNVEYKVSIYMEVLLLILTLIIIILVYFFIAFSVEIFFIYYHIEHIIYIAILLLWTLVFTGYFYLSYNKFFDTESREVSIYILLLSLYVIALLAKEDFFFNIISFYKPYNDSWLNTSIQYILYDYIIKYSEYIIDWALIQGMILAILIYYNFGGKRQNKYENKINKDRKAYLASLKIIKIIEEIYRDREFKEFCLNISKHLNNDNYLFVDKIVKYNKSITLIYKDLEDSNFDWLLKRFSLNFLSDSQFIETIVAKANTKKLMVCNSCKQLFFSTKRDTICENCRKHSIIIF